ncbi:MAG: uncharacterized protein QOH26_622 [Actinomycetota bacterium]|nr:uncharacterized protein [Actinomycetota bacterium]
MLLMLVLGGCASDDDAPPPSPKASIFSATVETCDPPEPSPPERPEFGRGTALIETDDGSRLVNIEIAQTDEQRQFGLMFQTEMAANAGMAFIFFEENVGGFYMKNTYLPLSIAYFDVDGKILKIVDMEPCETNSTLYDPGAPYRGTLEVNQGQFEAWGVSKGDVINLVPADTGGM